MRLGARRTGLLAVGILAVAGCTASAVEGTDGGACTTGDECPSGFCLDGRCVPPGADADADGEADAETEAEAETTVEAEAETEAVSDADDGGMWTDTDGDTIPDSVEGWTDADGDTIPNAEDRDSDGDGIGDDREAGDADVRTAPRDTDRDGTADFLDVDSDGDTIPDAEERLTDHDGDTIPGYLDSDSDGDGIPDSIEAGDRDLATPPVDTDGDTIPDYLDLDSDNDTISDAHESILDTDGDTIPDYLDLDSDNDGLTDAEEAGDTDLTTPPLDCDGDTLPNYRDTDSDNDGVRDFDEVRTYLTDPCDPDSDDDDVTDLVEVTYGSDPNDDTDSPLTRGDFVFVEPYMDDPEPWHDTLVFSTALQKADVYFLVDTTGSMAGEIGALRSAIRLTVIPGILAAIPDSWTGVGHFDDYPWAPFGDGASGDVSYANLQNLTPDAAAAQTAANLLPNHYGADDSESHVPALWTVATGSRTRTLPAIPAPFCPAGYVGYPCFRADAVRVIVLITDAPYHNGPGGYDPYYGLPITAPTYAEARDALVAAGIKVIAVHSDTWSTNAHDLQLARDTGAVDAGGTALVYGIPGTGTGLGTQVINAVRTLASNVPIRVDAQFVDDASDAVDTQTEFLDYLETNTSGRAIWDPATSTTRVCTSATTGDSSGDGHPDYFPSLLPGTSVCWDIHVNRNTTVAATAVAQLFRATLDVVGDRFTPLDSRDIYFLVPPVIQGSH